MNIDENGNVAANIGIYTPIYGDSQNRLGQLVSTAVLYGVAGDQVINMSYNGNAPGIGVTLQGVTNFYSPFTSMNPAPANTKKMWRLKSIIGGQYNYAQNKILVSLQNVKSSDVATIALYGPNGQVADGWKALRYSDLYDFSNLKLDAVSVSLTNYNGAAAMYYMEIQEYNVLQQ